MPIEICFHCNSQHLHGAIRAPLSSNTTHHVLFIIIIFYHGDWKKPTKIRMRRRLWKGKYVCICTETGPFSSSPFVLVFPLKIADLVVQKLHFTAFLNLDKDREWGLWAVFGINWEESNCSFQNIETWRWLPFVGELQGLRFPEWISSLFWEYRLVRGSQRV